ncbi:MAG: cyclodeaminase/cyclohydrolase family protein [Eubacteriales bacterium]|nr:cyclodeaminase/cyclohydrolase family protein [Eubacteriales bacterium]
MEKKMIDMDLREALSLTASNAPAPGGGAIAALTAALGAALGQMVLALSYGKKAFENLEEDIKTSLKAEDEKLETLRERLFNLMQEDTDAFTSYMDALRKPKETEEEKAARREALDACALYSMRVPLETAERCLTVLECLPPIAQYGNKNAVTDAGVASLLANAACEAALLNVKINLPTIKDEEVVNKAAKRSEELLQACKDLNAEILKIVYAKLG